ncbi:hypothetical protein [Mesorhizobium sp. M8A.F.Ca.ET.021.01.1.1]|uniref:hypothetical protein n=1 Tax=Mesorhizobium sp. M8A.F.Ca.ET.021.01.1.1 TaxID=2496757 RepID=UPI000FCB0BAD|nr:hypothetical protein [Mesorhizobium sp. M8A.F.Ca.ET.021.01.1.1]RUW56824.1 hypothetical protein EOA36_02170 [Mesorhizobium sp. M8A.F.Ca.ET.021.01.1.1]
MKSKMSDREVEIMVGLFRQTGGKSWAPLNPQHALFDKMIEAGYVRRVDGRCGFEMIKDAIITWTEAGHNALTLSEAVTAPDRAREIITHRVLGHAATN